MPIVLVEYPCVASWIVFALLCWIILALVEASLSWFDGSSVSWSDSTTIASGCGGGKVLVLRGTSLPSWIMGFDLPGASSSSFLFLAGSTFALAGR